MSPGQGEQSGSRGPALPNLMHNASPQGTGSGGARNANPRPCAAWRQTSRGRLIPRCDGTERAAPATRGSESSRCGPWEEPPCRGRRPLPPGPRVPASPRRRPRPGPPGLEPRETLEATPSASPTRSASRSRCVAPRGPRSLCPTQGSRSFPTPRTSRPAPASRAAPPQAPAPASCGQAGPGCARRPAPSPAGAPRSPAPQPLPPSPLPPPPAPPRRPRRPAQRLRAPR